MKGLFHKEILEIALDKRLKTGLICQDCTGKDRVGFFELDTELCLESANAQCTRREHQVSKELHTLMSSCFEKERKEFSFKLLEDGIDKIPTMQGREMLMKIERNEVMPGSQIWIKRDKVLMSYAHVLVYIGQKGETGEHEVVHVYKNKTSWLRVGLLLSTFQKINITKVINDEDEGEHCHKVVKVLISCSLQFSLVMRYPSFAFRPTSEKKSGTGPLPVLKRQSCVFITRKVTTVTMCDKYDS